MASIIMGGPGRSGTTYLAAALGRHPSVVTFAGVELKFLFERDGLTDLGWVMCESFSPNRSEVALDRFLVLLNQIRNGGFTQPLLAGPGVYGGVEKAYRRLAATIAPNGAPQPMTREAFNAAARGFVSEIAGLAFALKPGATHFLEKTPHNLLAPDSLAAFVGPADCLHIVRDPRATAVSLIRQDWGPGELEAAIDWVQSYYRQWFAVRGAYDQNRLTELRIEDIVTDPHLWGMRILGRLGLTQTPVFAAADASVLARGLDTTDDATRARLDDRLGDLAEALGYSRRSEG